VSYYNPFQGLDLLIPNAYRADVDRLSQTQPTGGRRPSPDDSPFPRVVDVWFLAVCLGARRGRRLRIEDPHKFNTGDVLARDAGRVELLEMIAIAAESDPDVIASPVDCLRIANEYAALGLPEVVRMVSEGSARPIWNLTDNLLDLLDER
jgi:hypothetical protein